MADLIDLALAGHGGIDRWKQVKSIEVELTISGALLELKGFPEHLRTFSWMTPQCVAALWGRRSARDIQSWTRMD
jgi:hypothetical protein